MYAVLPEIQLSSFSAIFNLSNNNKKAAHPHITWQSSQYFPK